MLRTTIMSFRGSTFGIPRKSVLILLVYLVHVSPLLSDSFFFFIIISRFDILSLSLSFLDSTLIASVYADLHSFFVDIDSLPRLEAHSSFLKYLIYSNPIHSLLFIGFSAYFKPHINITPLHVLSNCATTER